MWIYYALVLCVLAVFVVVMIEFQRWKIRRECAGKYLVRVKPANKHEYECLCEPIGGEEGLKVKVKSPNSDEEFEYTVGAIFHTRRGGWLGQDIATIDYLEGIPDPILSMKTRSMPLTSPKMETRLRNSSTSDFLKKWQEENSFEGQTRRFNIWFIVLTGLTAITIGLSIYTLVMVNNMAKDLEPVEKAFETQVVDKK
jgi:hypothetical protein